MGRVTVKAVENEEGYAEVEMRSVSGEVIFRTSAANAEVVARELIGAVNLTNARLTARANAKSGTSYVAPRGGSGGRVRTPKEWAEALDAVDSGYGEGVVTNGEEVIAAAIAEALGEACAENAALKAANAGWARDLDSLGAKLDASEKENAALKARLAEVQKCAEDAEHRARRWISAALAENAALRDRVSELEAKKGGGA